MRNMKTAIAALASVAVLVVSAPAANAAFVMTLSDGVNTATVTDGVANPLDGMVTYSGVLGAGAWIVNVTTGLSKPIFPNNDGFAKMDLNSVNVTSAAGGNLSIWMTDTDFVVSRPGTLIGRVGGTTNGTTSFVACKDENNAQNVNCNGLTPIVNLGPFSAGRVLGYEDGEPWAAWQLLDDPRRLHHA